MTWWSDDCCQHESRCLQFSCSFRSSLELSCCRHGARQQGDPATLETVWSSCWAGVRMFKGKHFNKKYCMRWWCCVVRVMCSCVSGSNKKNAIRQCSSEHFPRFNSAVSYSNHFTSVHVFDNIGAWHGTWVHAGRGTNSRCGEKTRLKGWSTSHPYPHVSSLPSLPNVISFVAFGGLKHRTGCLQCCFFEHVSKILSVMGRISQNH